MAKQSSKISLDFEEIKKNIKSSALLAAHQLNVIVADITKKAQKDLSQKEITKHLAQLLDKAKHATVQDILNNPKVKKLIENPKVQEFLKHDRVQEIINNPKVKEVTNKISVKAQQVGSKVKRAPKKAAPKAGAKTSDKASGLAD